MKGFETYQENSITTQSQGRIVVMLYEGAIKFLKFAISEMQAGDHETKAKYLNKAEDIINELNAVLDMETGGEIANNLRALYMFMVRNIHEGNAQRNPAKLEEVIKLLEELNQSWKAIAN
jgi:flagellar secretion chaperone FliS